MLDLPPCSPKALEGSGSYGIVGEQDQVFGGSGLGDALGQSYGTTNISLRRMEDGCIGFSWFVDCVVER